MMRSNRRFCLQGLGLIPLVGFFPQNAIAHRTPQTWSEVSWNERLKSLEIVHRFHIHTAETALSSAKLISKPNLLSLRARAQLALYCQDHFKLHTPQQPVGNFIPSSVIGVEPKGQNIYVYLETALPAPPVTLYVTNMLLRSIVPDITNYINIELFGTVRSLNFSGSDTQKTVTFM